MGSFVRVASVLLLTGILGSAGCFLLGNRETPHTLPAAESPRPAVRVSAVPAYRLIVNDRDADAPSRLIVLFARISTDSRDPLRFDPRQARLVLPNGFRARAFDRPRARALLRRTRIGSWNLAATRRRQYPAGEIQPRLSPHLAEVVENALLDAGELRAGQPLTGYVVIDAERPLASLDGAILVVQATRVRDATLVRDAYLFAAADKDDSSR